MRLDLQSVAKVLETLNGITFHDGVLQTMLQYSRKVSNKTQHCIGGGEGESVTNTAQ